MKLFFLLIIFNLFQLLSFAQAKNGIAYYQKIFKNTDSLEEIRLSSEMKFILNEVRNKSKDIIYNLEFKDSLAKFYMQETMSNDNENAVVSKFTNIILKNDEVYYYKLNDSIALTEKDIFGEIIIIKDSLPDNKWNLSNEKKEIDGRTCFKATKLLTAIKNKKGQTEIIAWYDPTINISFGPNGYFGLPGLIIEIEEGKIITQLTRIEFSKNTKDIIFPVKGKKMNRPDYEKYEMENISRFKRE